MRLTAMVRTLLQPSLVRRLLLAQLGMMICLWLLLIGALLYLSQHDESELAADARYAMILQVATALQDQPERQRLALAAIDRYQREADGIEDEPLMRMSMLVRQHGRLLYASPGTAADLHTAVPGRIEAVRAGGRLWRARRLADSASAIEVTLVKPAEAINVLLTFTSKGFLILPLAISLPFLAVPAWLSLSLALRPWRRLNREIAARGPHELSPLAFRPPHRELRPLADSLDGLLAQLRDAAARERGFIADAAHELRTPLAAMRIHVEALQQAGGARRDDLVEGLVNSSERAARVIAQLLSLMHAEGAHQAPAQAVALVPLAQDRLAALAPLAMARGVEFELQVDQAVAVAGNRDLLVSLLDNLVDNAVKYSPNGACVRLVLGLRDGAPALSVYDQGPGIAPDLRERVFDRFFRAPDQAQTGSGLGLAIVRANAAQHGASVLLDEGADGRGLCVTVVFPTVFSQSSSKLHRG